MTIQLTSASPLPAGTYDKRPHMARRSSPLNLGSFEQALCFLLEEHDVGYCLAKAGWDESSILDLLIRPVDRARFASVLEALREEGYVAVKRTSLSVDSACIHLADLNGVRVRFLSVTAVYGYRSKQLKWESATALIQRKVRRKDQWGLTVEDEFAYWLGRNSLHGTVDRVVECRLSQLVVQLGTKAAEDIAERIFGQKRKAKVVQACVDETLGAVVAAWQRGLRKDILRRHSANQIAYALKDGSRLLRKSLHPSGLFLALLGPDGVGKSTTTVNLRNDLISLFPDQKEFHWRPQFLMPRPDDPIDDRNNRVRELFSQNRHGDPARGFLISTVRLLGVMLDYWIGYVTEIRSRLVQSNLIVFDRYYHDILVDSVRYRYGGSKWLLRALKNALPPWRVFFIIADADEHTVYSRKQELTLGEIKRQRDAYHELGRRLPCSIILRTDRGVEQCRDEALRGIIEYLGQRFHGPHQ